MKPMKPTNPTRPTRSTIPCYAADGTSLGYRTLSAAQHLVADGYVRPAYGRKGHLRAIWLVRDDGASPVQAHAHNGTRYSYIESLATGRCWRLRRLDRRDTLAEDGTPVPARDAFLQVVRGCLTHSPDALAAGALAADRPPTDSLAIAPATHSVGRRHETDRCADASHARALTSMLTGDERRRPRLRKGEVTLT